MNPVTIDSIDTMQTTPQVMTAVGSNGQIADKNPDTGEQFPPTLETIEREIAIVRELTLSDELLAWVERYSQVGIRNKYLWNWCWRGVEVTTLSCVPESQRAELADTKVLGVMLDVLLDDVADENGSSDFLECLLAIPYGPQISQKALQPFTPAQRAYAELTQAVWVEIQRRVERYPRHQEFAAALQFDYRQLLNAMRYSLLLNSDPSLLNLTEHDLYLPHNMHMMISATMDVMCSTDFDHRELGALREAIWRAQYMGRIGNLVTTWEREIDEQDYTSGVFASAVSSGSLSAEKLLAPNREEIEHAIRSGQHEEFFLRRWQQCREDLLLMQPKLHSVNLGQLITGLENLICLHLGSRGDK